jgi:hypothetical protein
MITAEELIEVLKNFPRGARVRVEACACNGGFYVSGAEYYYTREGFEVSLIRPEDDA